MNNDRPLTDLNFTAHVTGISLSVLSCLLRNDAPGKIVTLVKTLAKVNKETPHINQN